MSADSLLHVNHHVFTLQSWQDLDLRLSATTAVVSSKSLETPDAIDLVADMVLSRYVLSF